MGNGMIPLGSLRPGERAQVASLMQDNPTIRRLAESGLLPGTHVQLVRRAPFKDPLEIRLRGYCITLRRADANQIMVRKDAP
ncbi:ferrous iron transport protein A [Eubacteriales bacterium OttesenSCG-928-N13]|nr:ferrous iron transport protein A [Eubacteriales bacterium OttesenSCG-928-N13]